MNESVFVTQKRPGGCWRVECSDCGWLNLVVPIGNAAERAEQLASSHACLTLPDVAALCAHIAWLEFAMTELLAENAFLRGER